MNPAILTIEPPLPCGVITAGDHCGRPACLAYAWRNPPDPSRRGEWTILPICPDCQERASTIYVTAEMESTE